MFEPVRRIENVDVFMKKLIRTATDLAERRLFPRERIAISERKIQPLLKVTSLL